VQTNASKGMRE